MPIDNQQLFQEFRSLPSITLIQLFLGLAAFDLTAAWLLARKGGSLPGFMAMPPLLVILLVLGTYPYFALFGYFQDVLATFYIAHYALSAVLSLDQLGAPVPEVLVITLKRIKSEKHRRYRQQVCYKCRDGTFHLSDQDPCKRPPNPAHRIQPPN